MRSQFLIAAYAILQKSARPMTPKQLIDTALKEGLLSDNRIGKTPRQTMNSKLSVHVRRHGDNSVFVRTAPGFFNLRALIGEVYEAPPRIPATPAERVLVFPSTSLDSYGRFQGISTEWQPVLSHLLGSSNCRYMDRIEAEQNDDYKQIVTYVMVTCGTKILAFKRGSYNRVEDFLRGSHCIGFGGHVSSADLDLLDSINMGVLNCASREVLEEIKMPTKDIERLKYGQGIEIVAVLNDDSSPTGRRHFGIIFRYEVCENTELEDCRPRELSVTQMRWVDPHIPKFSLWDFEYWSQLCFRVFYNDAISIQPSFRIRRRTPFRSPHILCILGQVGSGKSETVRVLTEECGYTEVNSGKVMARILRIPPVSEATRTEFQRAAWDFISSEGGPEQLACAIWGEINAVSSSRILVDGIRQRSTLESFRELAGKRRIAVVYVHTPPDVAYEFYRDRLVDNASIHEFLSVRDAPVEREVMDMLAISDAVLYNWTGRTEYREIVQQLISEISN